MIITIYEIGLCLIDAFLAIWFIERFQKDKCKYGMVFYAGVLIHVSVNVFALFITVFSPIISMINLAILILYSLMTNRIAPVFKRIAAPFVFEGLLIASNTVLFFLLTIVLNDSFESVLNNKGTIFCVFGAFSKLILWSVSSLALRLLSKTKEFRFKDYFLLIVFPVFIFCEMTILIKIGLTYHISEYYGYFFLAFITLGATYVCVYYLVYKISKNNQLKSERELYKQMLDMERRRYEDITDSADQIKRLRHDMKNQLLVIQSKLYDGDSVGAREILDRLAENVHSAGMVIETGNRLIDYVLNLKLGSLNNVVVFTAGDASKLSGIDDLDLSIMFGNLIDNIMEAIANVEHPQIEVLFFEKGNYCNLILKNTISSSVLKENPILQTTKNEKSAHGYGLKSVRSIVDKYSGTMDIYEENDMFCVHIAVPAV